ATMDRLFHSLRAGAAGDGRDADAALVAAVRMTAATPARAVGLHRVGGLRTGYDANLVVLDHDWQVAAVMARGDWLVN
ncbi:MAG TPA: amidohydrolase family protein, partial [Mycobacterium sp.]|nr:amidohydrolase family protein [Mycobacterium sp.]